MTTFSIPSVPISYYDWRLRKVVTIGSPVSASSIKADTNYTIVRPNINPSDAVNYTLWPITVNANTGVANVNDVGFLWWNPKTQQLSRTENVTDYPSTFSATGLQQTYRLNSDAFTTYGKAFSRRLVDYTPTTGDFIPYYTQGSYATAVSSLVRSRDEWQALFDSGTEVIIPGIGKKVIQYGDGVQVIQNSDGTLDIVSDVTGGLLAIRPYIDSNKWFWLTSFPQFDDTLIFQASQRLPTIVDLIDLLNKNTTEKTLQQTSTASPKGFLIPPPLTQNIINPASPVDPTFNTLNQETPIETEPLSEGIQTSTETSPSLLGYIASNPKTDEIRPIEDPLNPNKTLGLSLTKTPDTTANNLLNELTQVVEDVVRRTNTNVDARRFSILSQNEGLSITDDPSSLSEDRILELTQGQRDLKGGLNSGTDTDMLKEAAQQNTPEVRRQKAMQLRYYFGF